LSNTAQGEGLFVFRKLMFCALERNDLDNAKEAFRSMDEGVQNQPMTLYLACKLALRSGDPEMASNCIETISGTSMKDLKFLYACCLEAQQSGEKLCTLKALQLLANKFEFNGDCEIHFPALLRSTIRVQVSLLEPNERSRVNIMTVVDDICRTFEAGK
jgi:hypothetical protein